jgi:hypothetical protein
MSERVDVPTQVLLQYWRGKDEPGRLYQNAPVEPEFTEELIIALRHDDGEGDPRAPLIDGAAQVHLSGTPRALESFGRYLIALARLETADPDPHEHFEEVQNADGGNVHLIVHRATR